MSIYLYKMFFSVPLSPHFLNINGKEIQLTIVISVLISSYKQLSGGINKFYNLEVTFVYTSNCP